MKVMKFPGQREDETVLALVNKHWIVYGRIVFGFFIVVILPLVLFNLFWFTFYSVSTHYRGTLLVGLFSCIYFLYALLFTCIRWVNEEFDVLILTNDRLIDITQITLLKRSVTSTPLEQIQDTTGLISGFVGTIFHYGDLEVQTAAGDASDFSIDSIPNPEGVAQQILDWADKKRHGKPIKEDPTMLP